jgi:thioredoxin 1
MSGLYPYTILFLENRMKPLVSTIASFALLLIATLASAAEVPFNQTQFGADKTAGKPVAVVFHAWWCPTCRAQAPLLKTLAEQPEFAPVTVYIANYDSEKNLKKSLGVTKQSTIVVFKGGAERARSTGDTRQDSLAALLRNALS